MKSLMINLICLALSIQPSNALAHEMIYFTSYSMLPATHNQNIQICMLDNKSRLLDIIHNDINNQIIDEDSSTDFIVARYKPGLNKAAASYQCLFEAIQLQIKKIPALVIDKHYVAYGITGIDKTIDNLDETAL